MHARGAGPQADVAATAPAQCNGGRRGTVAVRTAGWALMTFVHPLLLGGLALVGIPVLIHLVMRQKPKRLPFPALRFLLAKHHTNQRTLRLRHLLLLLLRMAVIALLCLALVRPKLSGDGVLPALTGDRPVNAVLLVDTSPSMDYTVAGKSWLDEARRRATELLDELPEGSHVAVLDSAEAGGEWSPSPSLARERLGALRVRHTNAPLTRQTEQAYRLFAELDRERDGSSETVAKVLYVFSDRTAACWDETAAKTMRQPDDVTAVFVDVGADAVADLAVVEVKPERTSFWPGETVAVNVTVRATGKECDTWIACAFDGEAEGERRPLKLPAGRSEVLVFHRETAGRRDDGKPTKGLAEGLHQVEVRLGSNDALAFNNVGFATVRVLGGRRVLVLTDDVARDTDEWKRRLAATFQADVKAADDAETIDLSAYGAVFLAHLVRPSEQHWKQLEGYVGGGGGLAILPGGQGRMPEVAAYDGETARKVLPGRLRQIVDVKDDAERRWSELEAPSGPSKHPFLAPFRRWRDAGTVDFLLEEASRPSARRFWQVEPIGDETEVIAHYRDRDSSPALLERLVGRGRVLLLTTPLEPRKDPKEEPWTNYFGLNSSFGLVLTNLLAGTLAGDAEETTLNYVAGQAVTIPLPARPFFPRYLLAGPGVAGADADLPRLAEQKELRIVQAASPGNFAVLDGDGKRLAAFSVASHPDESSLERVPAEQIESLLGPGSVLPVGRATSLRDVLQQRGAQPLELAPGLLVLLLIALAAECFLANRFYRRSSGDEGLPLAA